MKRSLPRPELLQLFSRAIQIRIPSVRIIFDFAEQNDTHVEAGIFFVPSNSVSDLEDYAYTVADVLTQGTGVMITPCLRDVETTLTHYPELAAPNSEPPLVENWALSVPEEDYLVEDRATPLDACAQVVRAAANEDLALAA